MAWVPFITLYNEIYGTHARERERERENLADICFQKLVYMKIGIHVRACFDTIAVCDTCRIKTKNVETLARRGRTTFARCAL